MNEEDPKNFSWYVKEYKGAIIGAIVALVCIATGLAEIVIGLAVIVLGAFVGNYVQNNKDIVKEKLTEFISKF